jgi:hypothetical protein
VSTQSSNPNRPGRWEAEEEESPGPKRKSGIDAAVKKLSKYLKLEAPLVRGSDRSWAVSKARTTIAYVIVRRFGYRLKDLAANFGREAVATGTLLARISERLQTDLKRISTSTGSLGKSGCGFLTTGPSVVFPKSVEYLGVIPGKLAIANATRNPDVRAGLKPAPTRFRGYDGGALADLFCEL